jgi:ankyrin repeat protein
MYLNTPDKGALETPLHFACKFNYYEVAKLFLSHPLCDTTLRNRDGKKAEEVNEKSKCSFLDTIYVQS